MKQNYTRLSRNSKNAGGDIVKAVAQLVVSK